MTGSPRIPGLFVVGTDTGVGKTLVSTSLVRRWAAAGRRIAVMKPCETGDGDDAAQLMRAAGRPTDAGLVNPYRFALPAAPAVAAVREGKRVDLEVIIEAAKSLSAEAERLVVEGAGGLLVPFAAGASCADLIVRLQLPVVLVSRTALGTMNHTLLSVEALRTRAIPLVGVVFSRSTGPEGPEEAASMKLCAELGDFRTLGIVPSLGEHDRHEGCAAAMDCEAIWDATA